MEKQFAIPTRPTRPTGSTRLPPACVPGVGASGGLGWLAGKASLQGASTAEVPRTSFGLVVSAVLLEQLDGPSSTRASRLETGLAPVG